MGSLKDHARRIFGEHSPEVVPDVAEKLFNPLGLSVGSAIKLAVADFVGRELVVQELLEYDYGAGQEESAYIVSDGVKTHRLWLAKVAGRFRAVVMTLHDELEENAGIRSAVNDRGGKFVITTAGVKEQFERLNAGRISRKAEVSHMADRNGDGEIRPEETQRYVVEVWDYSRDATRVEFLFVERGTFGVSQTPRFRLWRGTAIPPEKIEIA